MVQVALLFCVSVVLNGVKLKLKTALSCDFERRVHWLIIQFLILLHNYFYHTEIHSKL